MGEIDEIHQPERDREPAGQHEQQHAVGDAVEQDGEQRGHAMAADSTRSNIVIPGQRGSAEPGTLLSTSMAGHARVRGCAQPRPE